MNFVFFFIAKLQFFTLKFEKHGNSCFAICTNLMRKFVLLMMNAVSSIWKRRPENPIFENSILHVKPIYGFYGVRI